MSIVSEHNLWFLKYAIYAHEPTDLHGSVGSKFKIGGYGMQSDDFTAPITDLCEDNEYQGELFLRSKWQIQGYLNEQADLLER